MSYQSTTIQKCINAINEDRYVMPAIQREFVWKPEQIEQLFDSLMQGFPINSFLFWQIDSKNINDYQFYKFIQNYHEKDATHNIRFENKSQNQLIAVLDGQQRLTSLYIGLVGSYAEKVPYKRKDNDDAYPIKRLYFNLLSGEQKEHSADEKFEFKFLPLEEKIFFAEEKGIRKIWYKVADILDVENGGTISIITSLIFEYALQKAETELISRNLQNFWNVIHQSSAINFHLEESNQLDKVLQIFIRVNSGGTKLSYSDLLMSIATSDWKGKDAREEIFGVVDEINKHDFNISKDFVLKTCLILSDFEDITFNIKNFNKANMQIIENNWEKIKESIKIAFTTLKHFGLNDETVPSYNAIIPVIYYIYKRGNPKNFHTVTEFSKDRELIFNWLVRTSLKQTFSAHPDNLLKAIRDLIKETQPTVFPLEAIIEKLKKDYPNKSISFENDSDFDFIRDLKYGKPATYFALALLGKGKIPTHIYHQDHVFPQFQFNASNLNKLNLTNEDRARYEEKKNTLGNIQLLQGNENQSKSDRDFKVWLEETYKNETERNAFLLSQQMPIEHSLEFVDFLSFVTQRENKIIEAFKQKIAI